MFLSYCVHKLLGSFSPPSFSGVMLFLWNRVGFVCFPFLFLANLFNVGESR